MLRIFSNRSSLGKLMLLIGALVAVPPALLPLYVEDAAYALSFLPPAIGSMAAGLIVCLTSKRQEPTFEWRSSMQRSSLTVLFAWCWGILMGAIPFLISGQLPLLHALFEAVSGWTTTGLSVMDVQATPRIFLFHRSFMQFCGGLGFVMMMVMLVQDKQSMNLYNAEGHPDKLMPNLKKTAQTVCLMYNGFLIAGTAAYTMTGMTLFDGLNHAMCALSTGGFSTKLNSIGEYNSLPIEMVTIALMIIGTTNFAVLMLATHRKWRQVLRVSEVRFFTLLLLVSVPVAALSLARGMGMGLGEGFRHALFDLSSALSTTGYSTMSYTAWPPLAIGLLILMMLIGGGVGSTAGGMKLTRAYLFVRIVLQNLRKRVLSPRSVEAPYYVRAQGRTSIDADLTMDIVGFVGCYLGLFILGSLLLTAAAGCSLIEGLFEFGSALGTVGLSIGITAPTANAATLIVEMFGMILGRLEIFIVLIGIYSGVSLLRPHRERGCHAPEATR